MKIQDIRKMAKDYKIDSFGKSKMEIIRSLQKAEGNFDCYGRASSGFCDQGACVWKEDCLKESLGEPVPAAPVKTEKISKVIKKAAPRRK